MTYSSVFPTYYSENLLSIHNLCYLIPILLLRIFKVLSNEYLKQVSILGSRAEQFERAGNRAMAEKVNFAIQDLDFKFDPDLAGPMEAGL